MNQSIEAKAGQKRISCTPHSCFSGSRLKVTHDSQPHLATNDIRYSKVRDSISRVKVVVIRRVLGEFVVVESIFIFIMELVCLMHFELVVMLERFRVFGL